jgi:ABC-type nickel/cobalt efflux system permease component RcnA
MRRLSAAVLALALAGLVPALVAAHPLGNFTINHYAGLRIEPERILLDVVIDHAEIPAFQARMSLDTDGDGEIASSEAEAGRLMTCESTAAALSLRVAEAPQQLRLLEAGLSFPPGAGGLATMRSVCGFEAVLGEPIAGATQIAFSDGSFAERVGWREIVVEGSGVSLTADGADLRRASPSARLTAYPAELLSQGLADTEVDLVATPGGPALPPMDIPDAEPVPGGEPVGAAANPAALPATGDVAAAIPGGVTAGDLPAIFRSADLTPVVLLLSVLTAAALGAGHALTPGHGKTLMAAYLVGTRGTPVHAAGLGLSVALSHTVGILALALLVVGAQGVLPPDVVVRAAPVVAAVSIVGIGGWMLISEGRRRLRRPPVVKDDHHQEHQHADHPHGHAHDVGGDHRHDGDSATGTHSHGGHRHSHLPEPGLTITWRSLFLLGLAGGLIPSASALLILLGAIAAGRPAFGFVLVVAFGLGMAVVMGGIGVVLVLARGRLDRVGGSSPIGRARAFLPLVASVVVLGFGLYLTFQALAGSTTL